MVGITIGEGKYCDTVGSLQVLRPNGIIINVSGMADSNKENWWEQPNEIIGKTVEIKAMKELPDETLREPRFKAIRYDR